MTTPADQDPNPDPGPWCHLLLIKILILITMIKIQILVWSDSNPGLIWSVSKAVEQKDQDQAAVSRLMLSCPSNLSTLYLWSLLSSCSLLIGFCQNLEVVFNKKKRAIHHNLNDNLDFMKDILPCSPTFHQHKCSLKIESNHININISHHRHHLRWCFSKNSSRFGNAIVPKNEKMFFPM